MKAGKRRTFNNDLNKKDLTRRIMRTTYGRETSSARSAETLTSDTAAVVVCVITRSVSSN